MTPTIEASHVPLKQWRSREATYHAQIRPWMDAYRQRRENRSSHPVHDFLFEYYQFNRKQVYHWHPSFGEVLHGQEAEKFLSDPRFQKSGAGIFLAPDTLTEKDHTRIAWISKLIKAALHRPDRSHCYGMHEWAMVYKASKIRHQSVPLRMEAKEIEAVVAAHPICCTHYDAFRFFTPEARPLNSLQPTADDRSRNEQFGCIHFNMDLFKWCYKLYPWISSELTLKCFQLAIEARELDMRASPYDLTQYGFEPIPIETVSGKQDYQTRQKSVALRGRELAVKFLEECCKVTCSHAYQDLCTHRDF